MLYSIRKTHHRFRNRRISRNNKIKNMDIIRNKIIRASSRRVASMFKISIRVGQEFLMHLDSKILVAVANRAAIRVSPVVEAIKKNNLEDRVLVAVVEDKQASGTKNNNNRTNLRTKRETSKDQRRVEVAVRLHHITKRTIRTIIKTDSKIKESKTKIIATKETKVQLIPRILK